MSPQEIDSLRKEIKHKLVDLDLDREGSYDRLLPHLSRIMGCPISKQKLSMALTGFRYSQPYQQVLEALHRLLASWEAGQDNWPAFPV